MLEGAESREERERERESKIYCGLYNCTGEMIPAA
jgi:hypothetical protein